MNQKIKETKTLKGPVVDSYDVEYRINDNEFTAQVLKHPGAVAIAAGTQEDSYFMVKQYRFGIEEDLWEFPAGKIDEGEAPLTTAYRELQEEIGYQAKKMNYIGKIHTSPAFLNEVIYLYEASDLHFVGQNLDPDETLEIKEMTSSTIRSMILNHEITDAKTIAMLYFLENR